MTTQQLNARLKADIDKAHATLEAFKKENRLPWSDMDAYRVKNHEQIIALAEKLYSTATELAELVEKVKVRPPFCGLTLTNGGLGFADGHLVASPLFVYSRERGTYSGWVVKVAYLSPDNCWFLEEVPMAELNDHGAKLRARLLSRGVNVSVYTDMRKALLNFILNSEAMKGGGDDR